MHLWGAVAERLDRMPTSDNFLSEPVRYGAEYLARTRLGQGAFRVLVTDVYRRQCAVTGERMLPVLDAAHIQPFAEHGPHLITNGLLLRSHQHTLFDRGYVTVTPELRVEVSERIRQEFENGPEYYRHHGQQLKALPMVVDDRPAPDFLRWHNEHVFSTEQPCLHLPIAISCYASPHSTSLHAWQSCEAISRRAISARDSSSEGNELR